MRPFQTQKGYERNCVLEELTGFLMESRLKEKKLKKKRKLIFQERNDEG